MNNSGDAAEQVIRIALEGMEYTVKVAGAAAKQIAAFLMAAFKSDGSEKKSGLKLAGKERLKNFLKSGKELTVFSIKDTDLKQFVREAKRYGLTYCVLKDMDGNAKTVEIMAKAEDSPKINRIVERLEFAAVDRGSIQADRVKSKDERRRIKQAAKKTHKEAKTQAGKEYRGSAKSARVKANESIKAERLKAVDTRNQASRDARDRYRADIGKKPRPQKQKSETAQLFGALIASLFGRLPFTRNRSRTEQIESKDIPTPEITEPDKAFDRELDAFLAPMESQQQDGQSKEGQNKAVQKEEPASNPPIRTEASLPSERGSGIGSKHEKGFSDKPSVKEFLSSPTVRSQRRQEAEKVRQERTGEKPIKQKVNQHKQPRNSSRRKSKKSRGRN